MAENVSLDDALKNLRLQAQKTLSKVLQDNQDRWEQEIQNKQQHLLEKIDPNHVKLNIGGKKFVTSKSVLTNLKGTKLDKMVTGKYPIMLDDKGRIFIDRNGEYFGYVLDCLRSGKVEYPTNPDLSRRVKMEYVYFGLIEEAEAKKTDPVPVPVPVPVSLSGAMKTMAMQIQNKQFPPSSLFSQLPQNNTGMFAQQFPSNGIFGQILQSAISQPITSAVQTLPSSSLSQEGKLEWKLSLLQQVSGITGVLTGGKHIKADDLCQALGTKLIKSGVHKWRFIIDIYQEPTEQFDEGIGEIVFGVIEEKNLSKAKNEEEGTDLCIGFSSLGQVLKGVEYNDEGEPINEGNAEGPELIDEMYTKNEITLTFNLDDKKLDMVVKGGNQYTLTLKNTENIAYYPYFMIDYGTITLQEAINLNGEEVSDLSEDQEEKEEEEDWEDEDEKSF